MPREPNRPLREAWIVSAVRTPIGRYGGALKDVRPDDLAALVIRAAVERARIEPSLVEDVILGCANQAGEDNRNVARMASLLAGFPVEVAGQTINRLCGSGLQAINTAAHAIMVGDGDVFVAGGVESMTRSPWVLAKPASGWERGTARVGRLDARMALRQPAHARRLDDLAWRDRGEGRRWLSREPRRTRTPSACGATGLPWPRSSRGHSTPSSCR